MLGSMLRDKSAIRHQHQKKPFLVESSLNQQAKRPNYQFHCRKVLWQGPRRNEYVVREAAKLKKMIADEKSMEREQAWFL